MQAGSERGGRSKAWYLLLLIPVVATLWVPFYNSPDPAVLGVPYFYWYQFAWVLISAVITGLVYLATREPAAVRREHPRAPLNEDLA